MWTVRIRTRVLGSRARILRSANAIHNGHGEVHQHHVRLYVQAEGDRLLACVSLHHLHARLDADDPGEPVGEEPLVVGDGYPDSFVCIQASAHDKPYLTSPSGYAQNQAPRRDRQSAGAKHHTRPRPKGEISACCMMRESVGWGR